MRQWVQLARLNTRVASLAIQGRWLTAATIAAGYDRAADTYNRAWQCRLRPVTDRLLQRLPRGLEGRVLDLGSGTGYAARHLALANPGARVLAIDVSSGMLAAAAQEAPANLHCQVAEMLDFLQGQPGDSAGLIVSTWALGYSHPARLMGECARVLQRGGVLAFIVNYADTLRPVFRSLQRCMLAFPEAVRLAAWPRFPKNWAFLERQLSRNGLGREWHEDGAERMEPPRGELLPWLEQTGILSGFEAMLPLEGPVAELFEREAAAALSREGLFHHYAAAIARKP